MKKTSLIFSLALAVATLFATACKNESTTSTSSTDTSYSTTSTSSSTDTSATTSTTDTSSTASASSTAASGGTVSSLSAADKDFVMKAAQGGMAEVTTGQLASSKATNADVKNFGNRMVTDHGKANDELKQLATNKGIALPTETDAEHKKSANDLEKKSGKDFDKAYMTDMVKDHEHDVAEFQKESKSAQDPDLKNWVTKTLPTLQDHLKMAKQTAAKVK